LRSSTPYSSILKVTQDEGKEAELTEDIQVFFGNTYDNLMSAA
jgi:hypothetical protein